MITGNIREPIPSWYPEALKKLIHIFQTTDFNQIAEGKHNVDNDDIFFIVNEYTTKNPMEARPEDHQKYVDLQFVFEGEERFGVTQNYQNLIADTDYDGQKDIRFYQPSNQYDLIHFYKGMYMVLMPQDIHVPGLNMADGQRSVKKIVGKINLKLL